MSVVEFALSPALVIAVCAELADCPTTLGTWTQLEITRLTELFGGMFCPAKGVCAATVPLWYAAGHPWDCDPTVNPFCARIEPALAADCPSTLGTATSVWLPDTVSTTGTFALIFVPAAGLWVSTVPTGCVLEMSFTV